MTIERLGLMIVEAAAVLLCPIAAGVLAGKGLRQFTGHRITGRAGVVGCLGVPTLLAAIATVAYPIVGLWDGVTTGFLCGSGILWTAHRVYADRRDVWLTIGGVVAGFVLLELLVRLFLGSPPAFPVEDGPHLLFSTVLRTTGPDSPTFRVGGLPASLERAAMTADLGGGTMAERPPSAMVTKEIVCAMAYGDAYSGFIDLGRDNLRDYALVTPDRFTPRPEASRRVLHIGDSMVFGANVARDQTFTAELERLEPGVQHINGGISGTAPDDYLVMLRSWIARVPVDLAVMYLFAGNDVGGLDAPHPCSNWDSLLVYDDGHARLRFPAAPKIDRGIGLQWLLINSPLPYLGRVLIVGHSAAAAFVGAMLDGFSGLGASDDRPVPQALEAILRSARDELHERHVPFIVVVLPHAGDIGVPDGPSDSLSHMTSRIAETLDLTELDATDLVRDALARGEQPIQSDGSHFNEAGHRLMARWLHEHLP